MSNNKQLQAPAEVLFEDNHLLIVNKKPGQLSQTTNQAMSISVFLIASTDRSVGL